MPGWRLRVRHHTGFQYASDVHASYNEARLTPADTASQLVTEHRIDVRPGTSLSQYRDYWGTVVHSFDLNRSHRELSVQGYSVVETGLHTTSPVEPMTWAYLRTDDVQDTWCEFLSTTAYTALDDEVQSVASDLPEPPRHATRSRMSARGSTRAWSTRRARPR